VPSVGNRLGKGTSRYRQTSATGAMKPSQKTANEPAAAAAMAMTNK
jgi:hypothetical protein